MNFLFNNKASTEKKSTYKFQFHNKNFLITDNKTENIKKNENNPQKWITLTFSDKTLIPEKKVIGGGGLRHNEAYLVNLYKIGKYLNRKIVLPPPQYSLELMHNKGKCIPENIKWSDYFNLSPLNNIDFNSPFEFTSNGSIYTNTNNSIKYFRSNININDINKEVDIVVLVSYNNPEYNLKQFSGIPPIDNIYIKLHPSQLIKNIVNKLLTDFTKKYTFIHIRRGDFLNNKVLAPPHGTHPYTTTEFIGEFIKKTSDIDKVIIVSTNEKDNEYKINLKINLPDKILIFENTFTEKLSENIKNDNYMIYQIMDEIARRSNINIITHGLKLGNTYKYRLADV
jgi:hypothetical protein